MHVLTQEGRSGLYKNTKGESWGSLRYLVRETVQIFWNEILWLGQTQLRNSSLQNVIVVQEKLFFKPTTKNDLTGIYIESCGWVK